MLPGVAGVAVAHPCLADFGGGAGRRDGGTGSASFDRTLAWRVGCDNAREILRELDEAPINPLDGDFDRVSVELGRDWRFRRSDTVLSSVEKTSTNFFSAPNSVAGEVAGLSSKNLHVISYSSETLRSDVLRLRRAAVLVRNASCTAACADPANCGPSFSRRVSAVSMTEIS